MLFLDFANYDAETIGDNFGAPEYSYFFVRDAFKPVFERLGRRQSILEPTTELEPAYAAARTAGELCALFAFCPPNGIPLARSCPTIPVFAWEYDTLPDARCNNNPLDDWTAALRRTNMAITHCSFSAETIRKAMGQDFPVWSIPAPVFERFAHPARAASGWLTPFNLALEGAMALSAGEIDLSLFNHAAPDEERVHLLQVLRHAAMDARQRQDLPLEGVVYTTIFNPYDGRKNWKTLISGFVWALRDTPTATLIVKLTRFDLHDSILPVLRHLSTLGPFRCKIILLHGMLSSAAYAQLVGVSAYAVNAAFGEGQCMPLMEYMSAGRPAIAPAHTAMLDYLRPENAFIVACDRELTHWPHDASKVKHTSHYRVRFTELVRQFRLSYRVAKEDAPLYARMSAAARASLEAFCSEKVASARLSEVETHLRARVA